MYEVTPQSGNRARSWWFTAAIVCVASLRLAHHDLLWSDEDYHLAAALNLIRGKIPYRDFWYDKPPLAALYYLLIGARSGWLLRLLDTGYVCLAAALAFRIARDLWSQTEGWWSAFLLVFFLTFYLPAGVIPFAADALLLVPHLAAILCVQRRAYLYAGACSGLGFLVNAKSIFVLATCAIWALNGAGWVIAGFAGPAMAAFICLALLGAWPGYVEQVWRWGLIYAASSPISNIITTATRRLADWAGFHAACIIGTCLGIQRNWRLLLWIGLSFASVCVGGRFVPRYFLQLLPAVVVVGSHGIVVAQRRWPRYVYAALAILLAVPAVRFGPRYFQLMVDPLPQWADVGMDEDSRRVAQELEQLQKPGDTLFVWGYRPDIYVYARLSPPGLFWDSQPLTGVPADRHLSATAPLYGAAAAANRELLVRSHPTFLVDGLGPLNPHLAPQNYPELRPWLGEYAEVAKTKLSIVYRWHN